MSDELSAVAEPLAIVLAPLGGTARSRVVDLLPLALRDGVNARLETDDPEAASFVEQVLKTDIDRVFAEEADEAADLLQEAHLLQAADAIAVVLNHAAPRQAAAILPSLPHALQGDVLHRMSAMNWQALDRRLGREEAAFLHRLDEAMGAEGRKASPAFAAAVLREVGNPQMIRSLLSMVYRMDPEATASVQDHLYGFASLSRLSDTELQALLTGVDNWDLALALREAPDGLRRRILGNVSQRRKLHLEEDSHALADLEPDDSEMFQRKIIARARQMYEAGKLYTYMGSVASLDDAEDVPAPESEGVGKRPPGPPAESKRRLTGVGAAIAGSLAAVLVVWLSGIRFTNVASGPSGSSILGTGSAPTVTESRKGSGGTGSGSSTKASDFAVAEGGVTVIRANGEEAPPDPANVDPGDVVRTDADGRAVVRLWADAGQAQVDPASSVQFGEEGDSEAEPPKLRLRLGNVWITCRNPALEVVAPLASIAASSGAVYRLRIVLDATTTVSVHEGTVWLTPLIEAERRQVVAGAGSSVRIEPSGRIEVNAIGDKTASKKGWLGIL